MAVRDRVLADEARDVIHMPVRVIARRIRGFSQITFSMPRYSANACSNCSRETPQIALLHSSLSRQSSVVSRTPASIGINASALEHQPMVRAVSEHFTVGRKLRHAVQLRHSVFRSGNLIRRVVPVVVLRPRVKLPVRNCELAFSDSLTKIWPGILQPTRADPCAIG